MHVLVTQDSQLAAWLPKTVTARSLPTRPMELASSTMKRLDRVAIEIEVSSLTPTHTDSRRPRHSRATGP
jgi:hypothetical protein